MYELDQHTKIDWPLKMWMRKKRTYNKILRRGGKNFPYSCYSEIAIRQIYGKFHLQLESLHDNHFHK